MKDFPDMLIPNEDILAGLFGRPISELERRALVEWEQQVREKVLLQHLEPVNNPPRWHLPDERASITHRFAINDGSTELKGYLTAGMYPSGKIGEIFIEISKEGSLVSGILDAWASAISIALQHGLPLKLFIDKLKGSRFDPMGRVIGAPEEVVEKMAMHQAASVLDYVVRYLEYRFPNGALYNG